MMAFRGAVAALARLPRAAGIVQRGVRPAAGDASMFAASTRPRADRIGATISLAAAATAWMYSRQREDQMVETQCQAGAKVRVWQGNIVHSTAVDECHILEDGVIGVDEDGKILFLGAADELPALADTHGFNLDAVTRLRKREILVPGLVDTHIHGAQLSNCGKGYDVQLLQWLEKYTFPTEARFRDQSFARVVYRRVVSQTLRSGTTTACYFASIHREGTNELVDAVDELGQRAYIGKVNMDRNSPENYMEGTADSISDTIQFVEDVISRGNPRLVPCITPRFAPSCTPQLLAALGKIAAEYNIPIQSHISESVQEIAWVGELFPDSTSYANVYDTFGLLTPKTVMAHCIYLSDEEIDLLVERGTGASHCPNSNFSINSGISPVRKLLEKGMHVGLGTDASGGYSLSIFDAMRQAMIASTAIHFQEPSRAPLSHKEAFFLATLGGSQALGLEKEIGNFEPGKWFDALVLDPDAPGSQIPLMENDTTDDIFSKLIYLSDDRNVVKVYVGGKDVTQSSSSALPSLVLEE